MDQEKRARRQSLRVIISEIVMVVAVVLMVIILALVVSGYWLNSDFTVERQGMLQVSSIPTGASVAVDGDAPWYQRTDTSKVLSSTSHTVQLAKDGYDSWAKTVNISEGLLYRLRYPRLFLKDRSPEVVLKDFTGTPSISKDASQMILYNNTTIWSLVNLESDTLSVRPLDFTAILPELASATVRSIEWNNDNNRVLVQFVSNVGVNWALIDIKTPANSINLTKAFSADFDEMKVFDNSAGNLLALRGGNLYKIDVSGRQISAVLAEGVVSYGFYGQEIIYATKSGVNILKNPSSDPKVFYEFAPGTTPSSIKVFLNRFYDAKYIAVVADDNIFVYNEHDGEEILSASLSFTPEAALITNGDFIFARAGLSVSTLDMESHTVATWQLSSADDGWLDEHMIYEITNEGELSVYDFDGLNHRALATNVASHLPVAITNDKWLYYFNNSGLIREKIIE
ncbi:PEGA domain-containing protein [Candidatus Saccharibacteria bacterium]|nr:PEGA domain-containing protein [Candidatus Saccharibacteria bacterium]